MDSIIGFIGLFGGLLIAAIGAMAGRHFANKKRGLDERYVEIERRSKNASWWITGIAMVIMFGLVIGRVIDQAIVVIGVMYAVHIVGASISAFVYHHKL